MKQEFEESFGSFLDRLRRDRGLSYRRLTKVANASGRGVDGWEDLGHDTIRNWCRGKSGAPRDWKQLAAVAHGLELGEESADLLFSSTSKWSLGDLRRQATDNEQKLLAFAKETPGRALVPYSPGELEPVPTKSGQREPRLPKIALIPLLLVAVATAGALAIWGQGQQADREADTVSGPSIPTSSTSSSETIGQATPTESTDVASTTTTSLFEPTQHYGSIVRSTSGDLWFITTYGYRVRLRAEEDVDLLAAEWGGPTTLSEIDLRRFPSHDSLYLATGPIWEPNTILPKGNVIWSADGSHRLEMQGDGNLVSYPKGSNEALWATSWIDSRSKSQNWVVFQNDGNLVTYINEQTDVFSTATFGQGATTFRFENDGTLKVYADDDILWSSDE